MRAPERDGSSVTRAALPAERAKERNERAARRALAGVRSERVCVFVCASERGSAAGWTKIIDSGS